MNNPLFKPMTYDFFDKDKKIGVLTIDLNSNNEYIFELDITDDSHLPWGFSDREGNYISKERNKNLHRKIIKNWLEERVFPKERHNADELLEEIGLTEYDLVAVLKSTEAKSIYDDFWINFH